MDKLGYRISTLDIASNNAAVPTAKYSIDTSLFDSLVDKVNECSPCSDPATNSADPADSSTAAASTRTLKQRLTQFDDDAEDAKFLADLLDRRLTEDRGEVMFEVGLEADGSSMDLTDDDVAKVTATLTKVVQMPQVASFVQLLVDTGAPVSLQSEKTFAREFSLAQIESTSAANPKRAGQAKAANAVEQEKAMPTPAVPSSVRGRTAYYLIRRKPDGVEQILEVRVAVVGNVDAGKSTMLGVLTQGRLDDGRGKARVALFRHQHEIESGRTSSVGLEILGFDKTTGAPVRHTDPNRKVSWDAVCERSSKLISFLDLAGHEKYLKTTVFGMAGGAPDYVMLMVAANAGLSGMAKEHLGLALALGIPVFVVITKIDMCPPNVLDGTLKQLTKVLRSSGCRKLPIAIRDRNSVLMAASRFVGQRVCPIFQISNVTGEGIDSLQTFLNVLPLNRCFSAPVSTPAQANSDATAAAAAKGKAVDKGKKVVGPAAGEVQAKMQFDISEIFVVPFVGTIVSGVVASGTLKPGDPVWLGPDYNGHFLQTAVRTIQRKRVDAQAAYTGQSVSLWLKKITRSQVRKGMVLLGRNEQHSEEPYSSKSFEAEVVVLYHSTTISSRYQAMVHCGSVRQTARVLAIEQADGSSETLRTGDRARVVFQFIRHPEYLTEGTRLIFREGRTKGVGKVLRVLSKAEEFEAVSKATKGTMVFDQRSLKVFNEGVRHKAASAANAAAGTSATTADSSAVTKKVPKLPMKS
ncbi:hypothetical protein GGI19_000096 [Coemansia pectinata]|uniref:Tr-type G domain-containing protein n=1 Tax=Coemansia pectinata TaxID=1052879 RepID=A0A9W8LCI6_9FUNG|nr:hypothetical protein GGI19_000096 [Coemansia pectinata]